MTEEPKPTPTSDDDKGPQSSPAVLANGWTKLLSALDPDPVVAGRKYEELRARLIDLARWRGARVPQDVADEAFERAARRLGVGEVVHLSAYLVGIVRHVVREVARDTTREAALENERVAVEMNPSDQDDDAEQCIARCLDEQPAEQRELLLRYLGRERGQAKIDQRAALAAELGLTAGALRMKIHRVRVAVETCVRKCLRDESATKLPGGGVSR